MNVEAREASLNGNDVLPPNYLGLNLFFFLDKIYMLC